MSKHQSDGIEKAVESGVKRAMQLQHQKECINHYAATERLLRQYKAYRENIEHPENFEFFPKGKSKSISIAPPPGSGMVDKVDLMESYVEARKKAYEATLVSWYMVFDAVKVFEQREEFIVIRMYYFGEDAFGNDKFSDKQITFEEIADELAEIGMVKSVRTLRSWRTKLVQEMAVFIFGIDAAISISNHKHGKQE